LADQGRTIRIPVHMVETITKYLKAKRSLAQVLGREPLPEEIAKEMNRSLEEVLYLMNTVWDTSSLSFDQIIDREQELNNNNEREDDEENDEDKLVDENNNEFLELGKFMGGNINSTPEDHANRELLNNLLREILNDPSFQQRDRDIIKMRFGLEDGISHTLEEIGTEFGVTRERIRQIEAKTLEKLKNHPQIYKIKEFLEY